MFNTIAAVSTPKGKGGIAVIRISGNDTINIINKCFKSKTLPQDKPRTAIFGEIVNGEEIIDTGLCIFFEEGKSYTGESSAEISCHGGIAVTSAVLSAVFAAGAVPAEAGEFTRRAFVNGNLTLTETEAIYQLIDADTESKRKLASSAARGKLSYETETIRNNIRYVLAALYAAIDYPDEDIGNYGEENLLSVLRDSKDNLEKLLKTYKTGSAIAEGVVTSICGAPNSGKSTLYNLLCNDDRAIVTDVAGTTRDTLWETVDFGGITLRLADTAGIHDSSDTVESIGINRAKETLDKSELVIAVFDGSAKLNDEEKDFISYLKEYNGTIVSVINKSDKSTLIEVSEIENVSDRTVIMSAKDGIGLDKLSDTISELFNSGNLSATEDTLIWNARHKAIVENTISLLESTANALAQGSEIDAVSILAEEALGELSLLDGKGVTDEIVNEIFAHFCVGK